MAKPVLTLPMSKALEALQPLAKVAMADLLVVNKRIPGKGKRGAKSTPTDLELHVNPAALGMAAVGAGLALWLLQLRLAPHTEDIKYGKWVWPDGADASKEIELLRRGVPPTRITGYVDVWRLYTGAFPNPYTVVSEGTEGAVLANVPIIETAGWCDTQTKTETKMAIKQRVGFLGGGIGSMTAEAADAQSIWFRPGWSYFD